MGFRPSASCARACASSGVGARAGPEQLALRGRAEAVVVRSVEAGARAQRPGGAQLRAQPLEVDRRFRDLAVDARGLGRRRSGDAVAHVVADAVVAEPGGQAQRRQGRQLGVEVGRHAVESDFVVVDAVADRVGGVDGVRARALAASACRPSSSRSPGLWSTSRPTMSRGRIDRQSRGATWPGSRPTRPRCARCAGRTPG